MEPRIHIAGTAAFLVLAVVLQEGYGLTAWAVVAAMLAITGVATAFVSVAPWIPLVPLIASLLALAIALA